MVDRIKQLMEHYNLSPAAFSEQIGINRSNLTHLFSGRNQPSLEVAKKILLCFPDIKTEWLIMGVGQMFRNNDERELNIQIQKEKLTQGTHAELDLFSTPVKVEEEKVKDLKPDSNQNSEKEIINLDNVPIVEKKETSIIENSVKEKVTLSHPDATIQKIVFFYSDNRFEIYHPK